MSKKNGNPQGIIMSLTEAQIVLKSAAYTIKKHINNIPISTRFQKIWMKNYNIIYAFDYEQENNTLVNGAKVELR